MPKLVVAQARQLQLGCQLSDERRERRRTTLDDDGRR
jgi:hypothetical protein